MRHRVFADRRPDGSGYSENIDDGRTSSCASSSTAEVEAEFSSVRSDSTDARTNSSGDAIFDDSVDTSKMSGVFSAQHIDRGAHQHKSRSSRKSNFNFFNQWGAACTLNFLVLLSIVGGPGFLLSSENDASFLRVVDAHIEDLTNDLGYPTSQGPYPDSDHGYVQTLGAYDAGWNHWANIRYEQIAALNEGMGGNVSSILADIQANKANIEANRGKIAENDAKIMQAIDRITRIAQMIDENSDQIKLREQALQQAVDAAIQRLQDEQAMSAGERQKLLDSIAMMKTQIEQLNVQTSSSSSAAREEITSMVNDLIYSVNTQLETRATNNRQLIEDKKNDIEQLLANCKQTLLNSINSTSTEMAAGRDALRQTLDQAESDILAAINQNLALYNSNKLSIETNSQNIASNTQEHVANAAEIASEEQELDNLKAEKAKKKQELEMEIQKNLAEIMNNKAMRSQEVAARNNAITEADQKLRELDAQYDAEIIDMAARIVADKAKLQQHADEATNARLGLINDLNALKARIYRLKRWRCGKCEDNGAF